MGTPPTNQKKSPGESMQCLIFDVPCVKIFKITEFSLLILKWRLYVRRESRAVYFTT